MSEDQKHNGTNLGDELGKIFKMGVGAVTGAVEKTVSFVGELTTEGTEANKKASELGEELTRKGEEILGKTGGLGNQIKEKIKGALGDMSGGLEGLLGKLGDMSDEHLEMVKDTVEKLLHERKNAAETAETTEPADKTEE